MDYTETRAGVICIYKQMLLFVKGNGATDKLVIPKWGFPKGLRNKDETTATAAIRELYEETGIMVEKNQFVFEINITRKKCNEKLTLYIVNFDEQPKIKLQESELSEYKWEYIQKMNTAEMTTPTIVACQELLKSSHFVVNVELPQLAKIFNQHCIKNKCGIGNF